jgi:phytoene synthase
MKTGHGDPSDADTLHCQRIIAEHSKSFALASGLLSAPVRRAAVATYAWCRRADDAIDHATDAESAKESLARLRAELDEIDRQQIPNDPVLRAIARVIDERRLPTFYLRELLAGMEMDVVGSAYRTREDLLLYCYRVAGVVGLMMCHVLGVASDDALPHAARLGIAMQLTNICRDVEEDWHRGRCYLPDELLPASARAALQAPPKESLPPSVRADLVEPVRQLLREAEEHYQAGDAGLRYLDRVSGWAIHTARLIYSGIGDELARRGYDVGKGRAFVPDGRKKWLAARALAGACGRKHPRRRQLQVPGRILEYGQLIAR